ncbi:MAG: hypothetical protein NTX75_03995 [Proteobacteria bacterium]|nr:hypothetical protein [Pseudomonadota bacterium]
MEQTGFLSPLYLLDITYDRTAYPLFYISVSVELAESSFSCEFDPVLLINTKAIQYLSQKYAEEIKKEWRIDLPPRHIYLSGFEKEWELKYLQGLMNEVSAFFGLDQLDLSRINPDRVSNERVSVSTQCCLSLFDRSDEALLNDYEELLTLTQAGTDTRAFDIFSKLSVCFAGKKIPHSLSLEGGVYKSPFPIFYIKEKEGLSIFYFATYKSCLCR